MYKYKYMAVKPAYPLAVWRDGVMTRRCAHVLQTYFNSNTKRYCKEVYT